MSDLEAYHVHGPVRTVHHQYGNHSSLVTFSREGTVLELLTIHSTGREHRLSYLYDEAGRLREVESVGSDGVVEKTTVKYDERGRRLRSWATAATYSTVDGRAAKTEFLDLSHIPADHGIGLGFEDRQTHAWTISNPIDAMVTTYYDEFGRPVEMFIYDKERVLLSKIVRGYDAIGRVAFEERQSVSPQLFAGSSAGNGMPPEVQEMLAKLFADHPQRVSYRYDEQNRVVEQIDDTLPGVQDRTVSEYNERGDLSREWRYSTNPGDRPLNEHGQFAPLPLAPEKLLQVTRCAYDYDEQGNWIRKTLQSGSTEDADPTWSTIENRTITYY